jgi:hypothetical protein
MVAQAVVKAIKPKGLAVRYLVKVTTAAVALGAAAAAAEQVQ